MSKIVNWFKDLRNQKVDGYICPIFPNEPHNDINLKILQKFDVKFIQFRIPFLDPSQHVVDMVFIPKDYQQKLDFLTRLVYLLPITCIFKKRILQGFKTSDYEVIELWTKSIYDELANQKYQQAMAQDEEIMKQEEQKAAEALQKIEEKRQKQAEEKAAKIAEREAKKQAEKERKAAEREAKKAEKEKLKAQKAK